MAATIRKSRLFADTMAPKATSRMAKVNSTPPRVILYRMRRARNARNCCQGLRTVAGLIVLRCDTISFNSPPSDEVQKSAPRRAICREQTRFKGWNPLPGISFGRDFGRGAGYRCSAKGARARYEQLIANGKFGFATGYCQTGPQALGQRGFGRAAGGGLRGADFLAGGTEPGSRSAGIAESGAGAAPLVPRPAAGSGREPGSAPRTGWRDCWDCWRNFPPCGQGRAGIEARIRDTAGDPARIAQLRGTAGRSIPCVWRPPRWFRALEAVTSGPVAAESLALARNLAAKPAGAVEDADPRHPARSTATKTRSARSIWRRWNPASAAAPPGSGSARDDGAEADAHACGRGAGEAGGRGIRGVAGHAGQPGPGPGEEKLRARVAGNRQSGQPFAARHVPTCWSGLSNTSRCEPCWPVRRSDRVTAATGRPVLEERLNFWRLLARAYEETPNDPFDPTGLQRLGGVPQARGAREMVPCRGS